MSSHFRFFLRCFEIKSECYSTVSSVHRHAIHRSTRKRLERSRSCWTADFPLGDHTKTCNYVAPESKTAPRPHPARWLHLPAPLLVGSLVNHDLRGVALYQYFRHFGISLEKNTRKSGNKSLFRWNERSHRLLVFSVKYFTLPSSPSCWICWMSMIHHFRTLEPATDRIYIFGLAACGLLRLKDYADYTSFAHVNSSSFLRRDSKTSCWSAIYRYL